MFFFVKITDIFNLDYSNLSATIFIEICINQFLSIFGYHPLYKGIK